MRSGSRGGGSNQLAGGGIIIQNVYNDKAPLLLEFYRATSCMMIRGGSRIIA